jgi:bifunctional UDP-N-acetylglucosamine pyrophosphorylase/glucosamine-1-phosphate N-acetyltransferase
MTQVDAIVLAAGEGKRMKSELPKVLHCIAGRPLIHYPVAAALEAGADRVVVVASPGSCDVLRDALTDAFGTTRITLAIQQPPLGTGDAARVGLRHVDSDRVLILYGDTPLLCAEDLRALVQALDEDASCELAFLSCVLQDPTGYGRVVRDAQQRVVEVREDCDLENDAQRGIVEVNAGVYVAHAASLERALNELRPTNAQGEYYLTDAVALAARRSGVVARVAGSPNLVGVNSRSQLVTAEAEMFRRIAERHGAAGVSVRGDARIDDTVEIQADATIETGVVLRGRTRVLRGARVDVGCVVTDSEIGAGAVLKPYCVLTDAVVRAGEQLGPFEHLTSSRTRLTAG